MIGKIIVVGLVIAGGVVYLARKRKKRDTIRSGRQSNNTQSACRKKMPIEMVNVAELSMKDLQEWFSLKGKTISMPRYFLMYSAPGKGVENSMRQMREMYYNIPTDKEIIVQSIYDNQTKKVIDARAITYVSIAPELDKMFETALYRDGIMEIEK